MTTLSLGIPGSATYAVVLAVFIILGLKPGPEMLSKHLELSVTMVMIVAIGSIIAALTAIMLGPYMAKVAYIPARILVPIILVLVFVGSFANRELLPDLIVLLIFGGIGIAMVEFGYNRAAFVLGFILGDMFEKYLIIAIGAWGYLFFTRPACLALIAIIIALMAFQPLRGGFNRLVRRGQA